jgi:hypothetical protein
MCTAVHYHLPVPMTWPAPAALQFRVHNTLTLVQNGVAVWCMVVCNGKGLARSQRACNLPVKQTDTRLEVVGRPVQASQLAIPVPSTSSTSC